MDFTNQSNGNDYEEMDTDVLYRTSERFNSAWNGDTFTEYEWRYEYEHSLTESA